MRYAVLALVALLAILCLGLLFGTTGWGAYFGWNLAPDGTTISYVTPGGPASEAGILTGDRIDWRPLSLVGRANLGLNQAVDVDAALIVSVQRGTTWRTVRLRPTPWPSNVEIWGRFAMLSALLLMAVGIGLVYLKPSRMTWGFLLASLGNLEGFGNANLLGRWGQIDTPHYFAVNGVGALLVGFSAAGILIFMSRFPSDTPRGPLVLLDKLAIPLGAIVASLSLYVVIATAVDSAPPPAWIVTFNEYLSNGLIIALALGALFVSFFLTRGSDRQRIIPVLIAFTFFVSSVFGTIITIALFTTTDKAAAEYGLTALSTIALALTVANGVIRHRVVDLSFAVSRTVVYTILTSILVGVFVLVDFLSNKVLEHLQIAIFLEVAVALAFGIGLNTLHSRVDALVDRTLFRRRHLAEKRLQRTSRTLSHAEDVSFVDEALVVEACDALDLASAAVFRPQGTAFTRVLDLGWNGEQTSTLSRNDHLIVNLMAELQPIDLADVRWPHGKVPAGLCQPLIAIPLAARHELLGFVLYGGHTGGEAIDPDERQTLVQLVDAATAAYEHVQARTLQAESSALRSEVALLHNERDLLREMVDTLRSVQHGAES